jgi:hypothetical protein
MAQNPKSCNVDLDLEVMKSRYSMAIRPEIEAEINRKVAQYQYLNTNLDAFAEKRSAGFWLQFVEIFKRNFTYLLRNKMSLYAALANSTVTSMLFMAVFWHIGEFPDLV